MAQHTKTLDILGDVLSVRWTGSVWEAPVNGTQHGRAESAMREELTAYLRSCGEEPDEESISGYLSQMEDGPEGD